MNYEETLDYLLTRLPMYSRIGAAAYKADLKNTIALCSFLDNPQHKFRSIHVAGTNGKGSVSHMLAAIFQQAGYKTGLYTSPHLKDFRERIRINGSMILQNVVIDFTEKVKVFSEQLEPSFFELTVAMAFDYFASEQVDIAIIETGLGGRLDSTNVINPELSIITNISLDHVNLLGDNITAISLEKAGIIKKDVPVIIGELNETTLKVFQDKAIETNSRLIKAQDEFQVMGWEWIKHLLRVEVATMHATDHRVFELDLSGLYQIKNLVTVLASVKEMQMMGWQLSDNAIANALKQVKKLTGLHGRWEIIDTHPQIVLDVAHNIAGVSELLKQIEVTDHNKLHFIIGMVNDKDVHSVLKLLPSTAKYYYTAAHIPRAMAPLELQAIAATYNLKGEVHDHVNAALCDAKANATPDDLIIVCGSVFLIGEVEF